MKHSLRRVFLFGGLCFFVLFLSACVKRFDVAVVNHRNEQVVIGIAQFHSEGFDGTPPKTFSSELLLGQQEITLKAGERRALVFNDASGGFWLRWRCLDPLPEPNTMVTLDLIRDVPSIDIK